MEEMGEGNPTVVPADWMNSHYSVKDKILLHFYSKEVNRLIVNFDELSWKFRLMKKSSSK